MSDFFALIRNELVKLALRPSTKWLLLALALLAAGYLGVWRQTAAGGTFRLSAVSSDLSAQIDYYESEQPEGFLAEVERLRVLERNNIDLFTPSWRLDAADDIRDAVKMFTRLKRSWAPGDQERARALEQSIEQDKELIASGDWKGYYEKKLREVENNPDLTPETEENLRWQYRYVLDYEVAAPENGWKYALFSNIVASKKELADEKQQEEQGVGVNRERVRLLENSVRINCYRIENGRRVVANATGNGYSYTNYSLLVGSSAYFSSPEDGYWGAFASTAGFVPYLSLVLMIFAAGMSASEFSSGTLRLLASRTGRRGKLLLAKAASLLPAAAGLLLGFFLWSALLAGLFNGFADAGAPCIYAAGGEVREASGLLAMGISYLCGLPGLTVYALLGLCLGALTRSVPVTVGASVILFLAGHYTIGVLSYWNQGWGRYLLFSNVDLSSILRGSAPFYGQDVWLALAVLLVHGGVFLLTAWDAFTRRDIA